MAWVRARSSVLGFLDASPQRGGFTCLSTRLNSSHKSSSREYEDSGKYLSRVLDMAFLRPKIQQSRIRHVPYALTLTVMNPETWRTRPEQL